MAIHESLSEVSIDVTTTDPSAAEDRERLYARQLVVCGGIQADRLARMAGLEDVYKRQKLVRCIRGTIVDCCLDLREDSPTFGEHVMVELSAENHRALWIPPYCGHGYLTMTDDTEVTYHCLLYTSRCV